MKKQICSLTEKLAVLSEYPRYKIGCIITDKRNNIISVGINKFKTHPFQYKSQVRVGNPKRIYLHAEISALVRIKEGIPFYAYVSRISPVTGKKCLSLPCQGCMLAIQESGIRKIYYTSQDTWETIDV